MHRVTVTVTVDVPDDLCDMLRASEKVDVVLGGIGKKDVVIAASAGVTLRAPITDFRVRVGRRVTYLAAADDIVDNDARVFLAIGEPFPAPNGWTYHDVIGGRALLGMFDTRAEAQAECDKWSSERW